MTTSISILRESLKKGVVTFQYTKKDGSIRTARGTTNAETIQNEYNFKGGEGPKRYGYTVYWDVDRGDFRCFDDKKFVGIVEA